VCVISLQGETPDEIVGMARAMLHKALRVETSVPGERVGRVEGVSGEKAERGEGSR